MNNVIIILGPTAVGKSGIAIEIAKKLNGEIISADSIQIYKKLNIGSGKIMPSDMQGIPHHMINILEPEQNYSVQEFVEQTKIQINQIIKNKHIPIIVGGTGLYISSLVNNYDFAQVSKDEYLRNDLEKQINENGLSFLYNRLQDLNPERASKISQNDKKRIIRALEIELLPKNNTIKLLDQNNYILFALYKQRDELYSDINLRTQLMFDHGLVEEVKALYKSGLDETNQSMKGIGYKEVISYIKGNLDLQTTIELVKQHSRNYAKRQLTWLRGMHNINWIDASNKQQAINDIVKYIRSNK